MDNVPVYIIAGGVSRRYGSDKARAMIDGVPMIKRVSDTLVPHGQSVTVVADNAGAYKDLGLMTIGDLRPGMGPMGGLDAALADRVARHGKGWLLLASCDLAEPKSDWVQHLLQHISSNAQAVAFKGERWEPLLTLYHSNIRATVRRRLDANKPSLTRLIEKAHPIAVPLPDGVSVIARHNTSRDSA